MLTDDRLFAIIALFQRGTAYNKRFAIMNIYHENGYTDRKDYLNCLAEDLGVDLEIVLISAELLGQSEDFDGLVSMLEDQF